MSSIPENPQALQRQMQVVRGALADDAERLANSTSALRGAWNAVKGNAQLVAGCGAAAALGYFLAPRPKRVQPPRWPMPTFEIRPQIVASLASIARGAALDFVMRTALDYASRRASGALAPSAADHSYEAVCGNTNSERTAV